MYGLKNQAFLRLYIGVQSKYTGFMNKSKGIGFIWCVDSCNIYIYIYIWCISIMRVCRHGRELLLLLLYPFITICYFSCICSIVYARLVAPPVAPNQICGLRTDIRARKYEKNIYAYMYTYIHIYRLYIYFTIRMCVYIYSMIR